jgi:hypothetical protein
MRAVLVVATVCALGACSRDEERAVEMDAPAGDSAADPAVAAELAAWDVRLDEEAADVGGFQMTEQPGGGWTVKTGPAGSAITWRDQDLIQSGAFTVRASVEERAAPADHREGYGLIVGGRNLQQPDQRYTYFLVRGNGDHLIKRRDGASTSTLQDWTPSPAVQRVTAAGASARNTLEIRVGPEVTRFLVNGTEVTTLPTDRVQPYGIAGLRVNHGLELAVSSFEIADNAEPAAAAP